MWHTDHHRLEEMTRKKKKLQNLGIADGWQQISRRDAVEI
jgi:hypothetical protein